MSISHANPGEIIDVSPMDEKLNESKTHTLLKTGDMEVIRLVMPVGKKIAEHQAPGEITVQCLEGEIEFTASGKTKTLTGGRMLYLAKSTPHALEAKRDSSVLVTILLAKQ